MGSKETVEATARYLYSRRIFRERAKKEFVSRNDCACPLLQLINEYVAVTVLAMSGQNVDSIRNAQYTLDLVVSFARTHFIVADLVVCCELIETATLLRKQFELLARLNELQVSETARELIRKTPNLKMLKTSFRRLYGHYSEISHSAGPQPLELLGGVEDGDGYRTVVYPIFLENAYISLQHVAVSVLEFYFWGNDFFSRHFKTYDRQWAERWFADALSKYTLLCEKRAGAG